MTVEDQNQATQAASPDTTAQIDPALNEDAVSGEQQQEAAQGEQQGDPQQSEPEKPQREPWYQKRIDEITRERRQAERERDAYKAMLERNDPVSAQQQQPTHSQPADPLALAEKLAAERIAQERLTDAANNTYRAGKAEFSDFDSAVQQMTQVADLSQRTDFLEAVTSLPNAHQVYYHLGKNPDEAAYVLSLPPVKMAIELAKVSAQMGKPKAQSKAAPPINPIGRSAAPSSDLSDDLPMDEWVRRRNETRRKRR